MQPIGQAGARGWRLTGVIFFGVLALVVLWASAMILRPFLSAIMIGAILVTVSFPLFVRVRRRVGGSKTWAAIIMLAGITFVLIIPFVILVMLLIQQANLLITRMQAGETQRVLERLDLAVRLQWLRRYIPGLDPAALSPQHLLLPVAQGLPGWVARNGPAVLGGMAGFIIAFLLVLLSAYFFYIEGETILTELTYLSPLPGKYDREFASRFKDVIDATFRGQVVTSVAQGFAIAIGLAIAGVSGSVFWGAVAAILSLLPLVGSAIIWVPAAIYLFVEESMYRSGHLHSIFLVVWCSLAVLLIDHVLRPLTMKGKSELPAIPLLFAVLGGMEAFGFLGLVVGPLVFSLLMAIIDIYKRSFRIETGEL